MLLTLACHLQRKRGVPLMLCLLHLKICMHCIASLEGCHVEARRPCEVWGMCQAAHHLVCRLHIRCEVVQQPCSRRCQKHGLPLQDHEVRLFTARQATMPGHATKCNVSNSHCLPCQCKLACGSQQCN